MATKPSSASTLPWVWIIETLASFEEVDTSVLNDLVKRTLEIFDDLGKNAMERVYLRILESLFAPRNRSKSAVSSVHDSKIRFDPSDHCEAVLQRILCEMSASNSKIDGPEMLKWDIQPFVVHKKACLPICALQQLKAAILEGNHPILSPLMERSGLATKDHCGNRIHVDDADTRRFEGCTNSQTVDAQGNLTAVTLENREGILQEDSPDRIFPLSKRDRSEIENREGILQEDSPDRIFPLPKRDMREAIESRESILQEGSPDGIFSLSKRVRSEVVESLGAQFHENQISADNSYEPHLNASKKLKQDDTCTRQTIANNSVPLHGNEHLEDSTGRIRQRDGRKGCDVATGSQLGALEESSLSVEGLGKHTASKSIGEGIDINNDGVHNNHPQNSFNGDIMTQDKSGYGERQNISVVEAKDKLSDEMRILNDALVDIIHQNISTDQVRGNCEHQSQLNTSNGACPMEHNSEPETSSDSDGHHDEKIDIAVKKRTFLSTQCTLSQDSLTTFDLTEMNLCMKCNKSGDLLVCNASACPIGVHESCLGSAASFDEMGNFYCPFCAYSRAISEYLELKKKASSARKDLAVFIGLGDKRQPKKPFERLRRSDQNNDANNNVNEVSYPMNRTNIEHKQVEPSASWVNGNLPRGGHREARSINETQIIGNRAEENVGPELQQIEVQADHDHDGDDIYCRDTEIVHVSEGHAEVGVQPNVLHSPVEAVCPPNDEAEGSSEEENDKSTTSSYSIRFRNRKKQYTYPAIPQLRRKKVPWTEVEEKIIQDGVRRFSSDHDRQIPWKKILEFGSNAFQKGRTTIDLKDKWRNMCKGSPKPK